MKLVHLDFVCFLEAVVRVSTMKALPFDSEIASADCADAGEYLIELRGHPAIYKMFIEDHRQRWDEEPRQPIERCVEHLVAYIRRFVDSNTKGGCDGAISEEEAKRFLRGERLKQMNAAAADDDESEQARAKRFSVSAHQPAAGAGGAGDAASMDLKLEEVEPLEPHPPSPEGDEGAGRPVGSPRARRLTAEAA